MEWTYFQKGRLEFGRKKRRQVFAFAQELGLQKCLLVCDPFWRNQEITLELIELGGDTLAGVFSDITPNPTVASAEACAQMARELQADSIISLGGGSAMDCAKAAALIADTGINIREYHGKGKLPPNRALPIIALPTTAGTGSEVTGVSVLTNEEEGFKAPIASLALYPVIAIVDPELTNTLPRLATAQTGLDVLSHAIEGYCSIHHQPVCDAMAIYAARLVFRYLRRACSAEPDVEARDQMACASVMAGLAFHLPKTGPSHACSYVLTNRYRIPHGEACALTLDYFTGIIAQGDGGRLEDFSHQVGYSSVQELCEAIRQLKRDIGVRTDLKEFALDDAAVDALVRDSRHPNMDNSPVVITDEMLYGLYNALR